MSSPQANNNGQPAGQDPNVPQGPAVPAAGQGNPPANVQAPIPPPAGPLVNGVGAQAPIPPPGGPLINGVGAQPPMQGGPVSPPANLPAALIVIAHLRQRIRDQNEERDEQAELEEDLRNQFRQANADHGDEIQVLITTILDAMQRMNELTRSNEQHRAGIEALIIGMEENDAEDLAARQAVEREHGEDVQAAVAEIMRLRTALRAYTTLANQAQNGLTQAQNDLAAERTSHQATDATLVQAQADVQREAAARTQAEQQLAALQVQNAALITQVANLTAAAAAAPPPRGRGTGRGRGRGRPRGPARGRGQVQAAAAAAGPSQVAGQTQTQTQARGRPRGRPRGPARPAPPATRHSKRAAGEDPEYDPFPAPKRPRGGA